MPNNGIQVAITGEITPTSVGDTFAVTNPFWGLGGLRTVTNIIERDAITLQRREYGMLVFVSSIDRYYKLDTGLTNLDWIDLGSSLGGGSNTQSKTYYQNNKPNIIPAVLVNPNIVSPIEGDLVEQEYENGFVFSIYQGGVWINKIIDNINNVKYINSTPSDPLIPGNYIIDSSAGSFNIELENIANGTFRFSNPNLSLSTNSVTILANGNSFTNSSGIQSTSNYVLNQEGINIEFWNPDGGTNFYTVVDKLAGASSPFISGGNWNAATNTPNLTLAANQVAGDGSLYIYNIINSGTQNLGNGSVLYEAGGEIKFFGLNVFRYDSPNVAMLPSQTGQNGKFLSTNGTIASWSNININATMTGNGSVASPLGVNTAFANNGLNITSNRVRLGGTLLQNTTINQNAFSLNFNSTHASATTAFSISSNILSSGFPGISLLTRSTNTLFSNFMKLDENSISLTSTNLTDPNSERCDIIINASTGIASMYLQSMFSVSNYSKIDLDGAFISLSTVLDNFETKYAQYFDHVEININDLDTVNNVISFYNTYISMSAYPDLRDDSITNVPSNFLYTDGNGILLSAPIKRYSNVKEEYYGATGTTLNLSNEYVNSSEEPVNVYRNGRLLMSADYTLIPNGTQWDIEFAVQLLNDNIIIQGNIKT